MPFFLFFIAITAELTRPPFDLTEAESELVGGFHTEYSSIRFALFFLAEFMNVITMSAIVVTLFFGGPRRAGARTSRPSASGSPSSGSWARTMVFLFIYVWLRAALPRLRYDQLMTLGWKYLIPLSLGWLMIVAGFVTDGWWGLGIAVAAVALSGLLVRAFAIGRGRAPASRPCCRRSGRRLVPLPAARRRVAPTAGAEPGGRGSEARGAD